eukprot:g3615.t1
MVRGGLRTLSQRGLIYLLCLRYPTDGKVGRSPYYKIGGTRDMGQRLQAYVTSQPFAPEVIKTVVVPDWRTAEAQILKAFPKPDDLDGGKEWRRFSPQEVQKCDCTMPRQVLAQVYELASLSLPDHDAQDWNFKAELLSAVRVRDGDVDLSLSHKEAGVALGLWLQEQRSAAQEGRLEVQRFERLVDLGVRFDEGRKTKDGDGGLRLEMVWNMSLDIGWETKTELEWQKRYRQLLGFRLREGDSDVEGLSSWVKLQRRRCKAEKLPKSQKTLLEQLGLDMAMKTRKEPHLRHASDAVRDRVEDYISALDTYADREGHVDVPLDHVEGNLALGRWLESQRSRSLHGGLDPKAKAELEKRGVNMDSVAACWFWNYRLLERFVKTEGHTQVPENDDLKRWIYTQQLKFRDGKLSLDKIHALQKLGVELEEKLPIGGENAKESAEKIKKEQKLSKVILCFLNFFWTSEVLMGMLRKKGSLKEE